MGSIEKIALFAVGLSISFKARPSDVNSMYYQRKGYSYQDWT
ncbi:MAG: hypothetical protein ACP5LZ_00545 [Fervidicoccaceae archaeon]|jgi:hypothetical protein